MKYTPIIPKFPVPKDGDYFFTQTLDYKRTCFKGKRMLTVLRIAKRILKEQLAYYCSVYSMVMEFTKRNKIHFHGYMRFRDGVGDDEREMFRVLMDDSIGHCDTITIIKDPQLVYNYMCKDLDKTNKIVNYKLKNGQIIQNDRTRSIMWHYQAGSSAGAQAPATPSPIARYMN